MDIVHVSLLLFINTTESILQVIIRGIFNIKHRRENNHHIASTLITPTNIHIAMRLELRTEPSDLEFVVSAGAARTLQFVAVGLAVFSAPAVNVTS